LLGDGSIYRFFTELPAHIEPVEFNVSQTGEDDNRIFSEAMKDVKKPDYRINKFDRELHVQRYPAFY
jgi:hypothetical protein